LPGSANRVGPGPRGRLRRAPPRRGEHRVQAVLERGMKTSSWPNTDEGAMTHAASVRCPARRSRLRPPPSRGAAATGAARRRRSAPPDDFRIPVRRRFRGSDPNWGQHDPGSSWGRVAYVEARRSHRSPRPRRGDLGPHPSYRRDVARDLDHGVIGVGAPWRIPVSPGCTTSTWPTCGSMIRAISHALPVTSSATRSVAHKLPANSSSASGDVAILPAERTSPASTIAISQKSRWTSNPTSLT
jgi:hypothetical protein